MPRCSALATIAGISQVRVVPFLTSRSSIAEQPHRPALTQMGPEGTRSAEVGAADRRTITSPCGERPRRRAETAQPAPLDQTLQAEEHHRLQEAPAPPTATRKAISVSCLQLRWPCAR